MPRQRCAVECQRCSSRSGRQPVHVTLQEGVLKEHLEAAQKRADEALASASLEERVVLQAQQAQQAKALRKAQVRGPDWLPACRCWCWHHLELLVLGSSFRQLVLGSSVWRQLWLLINFLVPHRRWPPATAGAGQVVPG